MDDARQWIDGLLRKFYRRLQPPDWPNPATDEWTDFRDDWIYSCNRHQVTEAEADEAIQRLRERPPRWGNEHLGRFLEEIQGIRRDRRTADDATEIDRAKAASDACPYCQGSGQLEVFDPHFDGRRVVTRESEVKGQVKRVSYAMVVSAHCTCALGRWIRNQIKDVTLLDRIVDLAAVLDGRSRFQLEDPTFDGTPAVAPSFRRSTESGGVRRLAPDPTLAPEPEPERIDA